MNNQPNTDTNLTPRQIKQLEICALLAEWDKAIDNYEMAVDSAERAGKDPETDFNCHTLRGKMNDVRGMHTLAQTELLLLG